MSILHGREPSASVTAIQCHLAIIHVYSRLRVNVQTFSSSASQSLEHPPCTAAARGQSSTAAESRVIYAEELEANAFAADTATEAERLTHYDPVKILFPDGGKCKTHPRQRVVIGAQLEQ